MGISHVDPQVVLAKDLGEALGYYISIDITRRTLFTLSSEQVRDVIGVWWSSVRHVSATMGI